MTTDRELLELTRLRAFFREVAELTLNHRVIDDYAAVYPSDLASALEKVHPKWIDFVTTEAPQ